MLKGRKNAIIPLSNSAAVEASWRVVYRYFLFISLPIFWKNILTLCA
nr:MAG TPA: hypothetical protein [Caudoviricetes sp.]